MFDPQGLSTNLIAALVNLAAALIGRANRPGPPDTRVRRKHRRGRGSRQRSRRRRRDERQ